MFKTKTYVISLAVITLLLYAQGLKFDFTNWDDPQYIIKNEWIRTFDSILFKKAFFETHFGHYHPFTWLSLAFDYKLFNLKPFGYHLHNLLLHVINVLLVFVFVRKLTSKNNLSFLIALAFSVHPFVNESVMWVTERKNLLFSLYYLLSLICFIVFIEKNKWQYYFLTLVCFLASLLSKGAAITLPFSILLILLYFNKLNWKNILKLFPFFIIAFVFAIIALKAQSPFLKENNISLSFYDSVLLSSWAIWQYIIKAIFPHSMSALHPIILDNIKFYYIIGLLLTTILLYIAFDSLKKNKNLISFGILFFFVHISMFLKVFNAYASSYYIAERYTYLSYIGLYIVIFDYTINRYWNRKWFKFVAFSWFIFISTTSYIYGKTWKNSLSLWENTLKHYQVSYIALLNYGNACRDAKIYEKAIKTYEKISVNSSLYPKMLENRAFVYYRLKQYQFALNDYEALLKLEPSRQDIEQYIVNILLENNNNELAKETIIKLLKKNSKIAELWNSLGNYYLKSNLQNSAIFAYSKAIEIKPSAMFYYNRANIYSQINLFNLAFNDYNKAIELDSINPNYFINRGITYYKQKKYNNALYDFNKAISLNPNNVDFYFNRSTLYVTINQINLAIADLSMIIDLQPNNGEALVRRSYLYYQIKETVLACKDLQKAIDLGFTQYYEWKNKICM